MKILRYIDPFVVSIILILVIGILVPIPNEWIEALTYAGTVAVMILFLVYGMRLPTSEIVDGLKNIKLQLSVLLSTFVVFPLLGVITMPLMKPMLGTTFALGLLYLTLLPSTVQSSVSFTSIAGGNVAAAVTSATISNTLGMVFTPLLVMLIMGASTGVGWGSIVDVLTKLLIPFIIGQFLQPKLGDRVRANKWLTKSVDRGTILIVVASSVAGATARGLWDTLTWGDAAGLVVASGVLLAVMMFGTWKAGHLLKMNRRDNIALLMCGSKKSLATGLPMAAIIFPPHIVAAVTVPVIVFHQLQLMVAAIIARRLSLTTSDSEETTW
ncbi:MAG: bile acid:sodium symporter family protein [Actinomycetaceae bacterium]|nr:bile acid:sodium symporter family protein [Actinomycetaceae bacterium]